MVDLSGYATGILAEEDRPLFEDAIKAAEADALRAAYVMIWLACAESLKRRFREAQQRDGSAGRIVGQIEKKEGEQKAVDRFVLDKAHEYGFLSSSAHKVLSHVYEMRCIYAHPYEEAPTEEQISHAAAVVVERVLSQPVKLKQGFAGQLLSSLLEDSVYLDDQYRAVESFVDDIIPRIDESVFEWLLDTYWSRLEKIADDSSLGVFIRRGRGFSQAFLRSIGVDLFSRDKWHDKVSQYPKTLVRVFKQPSLFAGIGKRAQDSLVGVALEEAAVRPSVLRNLERLARNKVLSTRQKRRFLEHLKGMTASEIRSARLTTRTCYTKIIDGLKSHDWYTQNPAVDLLTANGPDGIKDLERSEQLELGRNILQSAEGSARSAISLLRAVAEEPSEWPVDFLRGLVLECFTNEKKEIRVKAEHLDTVLDVLGAIDAKSRDRITREVVKSIKDATPQEWTASRHFKPAIELAGKYRWAKTLGDCLRETMEALPAQEDESPF